MAVKRRSPDILLFLVVIILLSFGLVMVFSSSAVAAYLNFHGDSFYYLKRQLIWGALGIFALLFAMQVDYFRLRRWANLGLVVALGMLVLVLIVGIAHKGSSRWLGVGSLSFQPSEVIKLTMVLFMAKYLSEKRDKVQYFFQGLMPVLSMLGVACILILLQPDLGTAVTLAGTAYLMLVAAGARGRHLLLLAMAGLGLVALAIVIAPYRLERFMAFLNPWADPSDTGFQTIQSLLALGSGGMLGMGLGQSRQKFFYLPERHTDFIFSIIGEELGFIGASLVLLLFLVLLWRGFKTSLEAPDAFGSLLACGLTSMICLQALINIGVATGSLPVTGITLPFISYGGSSLVFTLLAVGVVLNISRFSQGS